MKLWIISTNEVPVEVMGAEAVSPEEADSYLQRARRLVRGKAAQFIGRTVEESTGQVYSAFAVDSGTDKARTIFIADRAATRLVSTLLDDGGKLRRFRVAREETGLGGPAGTA
jgi:hypothetical protein